MSGAKLVFKRREKRGLHRALWEWLYPKGGWARAYSYIKHRLRRLPGTPEEIARGVAIGVFTSFTPFYGLHFFVAWVLALVLRANVLASLLGTFFGNPLTYIPIGATALGFGHAFLGKRPESDLHLGLGEMFARAVTELGANIAAFFSQTPGDWTYLVEFWHTVFFPWMIGGVVPGVISGLVIYAITVPAIRVYKNRRKGQLAAKIAELRRKTLLTRDDDSGV